MKKSELAKAIKSVIVESRVKKAVRQVLAEERDQTITLTLSVGEASAILDGLASSNLENNISKAGDMQGAGGRIIVNLNHAKAKLQNALNGDRGDE